MEKDANHTYSRRYVLFLCKSERAFRSSLLYLSCRRDGSVIPLDDPCGRSFREATFACFSTEMPSTTSSSPDFSTSSGKQATEDEKESNVGSPNGLGEGEQEEKKEAGRERRHRAEERAKDANCLGPSYCEEPLCRSSSIYRVKSHPRGNPPKFPSIYLCPLYFPSYLSQLCVHGSIYLCSALY